MLSTTHMLGGAAAAMGCMLMVSPDIQLAPVALAASAGIGVVGGLLPDIDHPKSKISNTLRPVNTLISLFFSHRGFFHTPILYLCLAILFAWKRPMSEHISLLMCCLFAGILSHLFLDLLNPGGIPLLFPVSSKRFHLAKIRTGGTGEIVVRVLLVILIIVLIMRSFLLS